MSKQNSVMSLKEIKIEDSQNLGNISKTNGSIRSHISNISTGNSRSKEFPTTAETGQIFQQVKINSAFEPINSSTFKKHTTPLNEDQFLGKRGFIYSLKNPSTQNPQKSSNELENNISKKLASPKTNSVISKQQNGVTKSNKSDEKKDMDNNSSDPSNKYYTDSESGESNDEELDQINENIRSKLKLLKSSLDYDICKYNNNNV